MDSKKKMLIIIVGITAIIGLILAYAVIRRMRSTTGGSTGEQIELVYWGLWEPSTHMQEVIDAYEADHPTIKISYSYERFTQYEDNLYTRLTDPQTTPDIVRINNTWTYKFQSRLSPVPPEVMTSSEYQDLFYPAAVNDFVGSDGYFYAIPLEIDGLGLYYNKDMFEEAGISEPPADWATLVENATALTETDTSGEIVQAGAALGCSSNINHSADILAALMLQSNVDMTSDDGTEATFNVDRGEEALTFYNDFAATHKVWSCGLRNDLEMFAGGKLAMMFAPSWRVFDVINMNSSINFGTAPFPQLVGNEDPVAYGMYWGEAVSAQSAHQAEAWQFIKYLAQEEQLKTMYAAASRSRAFGEPYSLVDLAEEIQNAPYVGPFIQMAPYYESWRIGDQKTSEDALRKAISDSQEGRSNVGQALEVAVDTINTENEDLYGTTGGT